MIHFHHHLNDSNHIKIIFLCSCSSSFRSPDIAQETGTTLPFSIAFSIERSRYRVCFCAFRHLVFENQSVFGHNINRWFYSCGLLIAFSQILGAIIGWKTFLVSSFSGHWNFTDQFTSDVIMASWPLPPHSRPQSLRSFWPAAGIERLWEQPRRERSTRQTWLTRWSKPLWRHGERSAQMHKIFENGVVPSGLNNFSRWISPTIPASGGVVFWILRSNYHCSFLRGK